jgi:hypothetical protein
MYAEDVNYWKTSRTSPDVWLEKAKREIAKAGGETLAEGFGSDNSGRAAYMLAFKFSDEHFKAVLPVLPTKSVDVRAARIQATTMLFHDVKAKSISAKVLGTRVAFFSYLLLPDGRTAAEVSAPELLEAMPKLLTGGG